MELKHGTVRLDAAAEWLSKTTGRTFTSADLIDAHDRLPIYARIPKSLARPEYSAAVLHAVQQQAIKVGAAVDGMAKKVPPKLVDVVELATETLPEDAALRFEWEKIAHEEGVYLLSARDLYLLDVHGVQQLHRGVSVFNRWIGKPIQFGNHVDVTLDMLCVRRSQLLKFAEIVAAEQPEARPDAETSQDSPEADTSGLVAWQAIAIESWSEILSAYRGAPTASNVVAWLKKHGPRDVFPNEQPDRYTLRWVDGNGNMQTVAQKTVANMVSAWRKAGKIPA